MLAFGDVGTLQMGGFLPGMASSQRSNNKLMVSANRAIIFNGSVIGAGFGMDLADNGAVFGIRFCAALCAAGDDMLAFGDVGTLQMGGFLPGMASSQRSNNKLMVSANRAIIFNGFIIGAGFGMDLADNGAGDFFCFIAIVILANKKMGAV